MQVPERLSLIGGSILLASTLIFTLKSQASNILPKVDNGMTNLLQSDKERQQEQQASQQKRMNDNFNKGYQQAQQNHWQTGTWGTAKFYVDDQSDMHVGAGQLEGTFDNADDMSPVQSITLDSYVKAPQDSEDLFSNGIGDNKLSTINYLNRLDTSNTNDMEGMFYGDSALPNLDVSGFNTHDVTSMSSMFWNDSSLHSLKLGNDTKIDVDVSLTSTYKQGSQVLNLDGNAHPGTWVKQ